MFYMFLYSANVSAVVEEYVQSFWDAFQLKVASFEQHYLGLNTRGQQKAGLPHGGETWSGNVALAAVTYINRHLLALCACMSAHWKYFLCHSLVKSQISNDKITHCDCRHHPFWALKEQGRLSY